MTLYRSKLFLIKIFRYLHERKKKNKLVFAQIRLITQTKFDNIP